MATEAERREQAMADVYRTIDGARAAWRAAQALEGLLRTILFCGGAFLLGLVLDNLLHLPGTVRLVYGAGLLAGLLFMLARGVIYPLLRPITDDMVAAHVERVTPETENRIINAVQLSRQRFRNALARGMVLSQMRDAARWVAGMGSIRAPDLRRLWQPGRWILLLAAVAGLYALLFSAHFGNAVLRFVHPRQDIPPITDTRLDVRPGDAEVLQGDGLRVEAVVSGVLPESARIEARLQGGKTTAETMAFEGNAFTHRFARVQADFSYRIEAGDALTRWFVVKVRSRPAIASLGLTYSYPAYTMLPERTDADAAGDIRAPVETKVALDVIADSPVREGRIEMGALGDGGEAPRTDIPLVRQGPTHLRGELVVRRSCPYAIRVTGPSGIENIPRQSRIEAVPDAPPRVSFVRPARDVAVGPEGHVTLLAVAEDDFSLRELHLFLQRRAGADWEKLHSWSYEPGTTLAREGWVLEPAQLGTPAGGALAYYMRANDGLRREGEGVGRSRVYHVRIVAGGPSAPGSEREEELLLDIVRKLIELQEANLEATRSLPRRSLGRDLELPGLRNRAGELVAAEEDIHARIGEAVTRYAAEEDVPVTEALARIAAGPVTRAIQRLMDLRDSEQPEEMDEDARQAIEQQEEVLALLRQLLEDPAAVLSRMLKEEAGEEEVSAGLEQLTDGEQLAERLLRSLDEFAEEQARAIELSGQLAEKQVDDFTEEDERKLRNVVELEKKWTEFFQEAVTDLSKLPPQDFSLATQAKEFLEVYSEVQQALEAAERKAIEMAVPHEQAGLELAEQIETNIEKWLMETKDNQLWSMEEPLEDYETPMTELPDELQDLIGDLVESEEDMLEQYDDITSGWLDTLDMGAGWDAMDGPISNMSAKGVTGNRLPNTQEVGGRSGEGRTGKSVGQFVEETATGKGGRQTPTRLTPDPYEAGRVEDLSGEAAGGATGGGKVSGQGAEGLQGPVPPPLQQKLNRLAARQRQLIDSARRLDYGLKKYRAPRARLPETIELMEAQQQALTSGEVRTFGRYQRIVLSNLRDVKELTEKQKQLQRDLSALLPKRLREEISAARDESVPEHYREMVRNYFRALSEPPVPSTENP